MTVEGLETYDYDLPPDLIAQTPNENREESRLLVLDRSAGSMEDTVFRALPRILEPGDLLVANESRVIPARLIGQLATGGKIELLLVRRVDDAWEAMTRPAHKLRAGTVVHLSDGVTAVVEAILPAGRRMVRFEGVSRRSNGGGARKGKGPSRRDSDRGSVKEDRSEDGGIREFDRWLEKAGRAPLPPYIHEYPADPERYQTVYATTKGSVAAPTAGLHFTTQLLQILVARGIQTHFVTLHVGPGTFQTLTADRVRESRLEPEWGLIPESTAAAIGEAKRSGRRIIAVGTTTTRLLEGVARRGEVSPFQGDIDLFIRPPFEFRVVDGLITNFHLPRSSLLMLVSAFGGREGIRRAYEHAITERYRFYSFGDAMLIL